MNSTEEINLAHGDLNPFLLVTFSCSLVCLISGSIVSIPPLFWKRTAQIQTVQ